MRSFLHRYGAHCCAEQVDTTEGCPKIDLFTFKGHDRVLHIGWSYGVGPKVNMRLFWIAYVCTLSDFLFPPFFRLEKSGSANSDFFFLVREKWLTRKKI